MSEVESNDIYFRCKIASRLRYLGWWWYPDIEGTNDKGEHVVLRLKQDTLTAIVFFEGGSFEEYTLESLPKCYMDWLLERTLLFCEQKLGVELEREEQRELERVRQHKVCLKLREKNLL